MQPSETVESLMTEINYCAAISQTDLVCGDLVHGHSVPPLPINCCDADV